MICNFAFLQQRKKRVSYLLPGGRLHHAERLHRDEQRVLLRHPEAEDDRDLQRARSFGRRPEHSRTNNLTIETHL